MSPKNGKDCEGGVGDLFQSYFSRNIEKLPSLGNRKSITSADSRRAGAKLMASLVDLLADSSRRVRDGSSHLDKRLRTDRVVHKSQS